MSDDQKARYEKQVRLLMTILPLVMKDARLALKGGTALNLFVRDLPGSRARQWPLAVAAACGLIEAAHLALPRQLARRQ